MGKAFKTNMDLPVSKHFTKAGHMEWDLRRIIIDYIPQNKRGGDTSWKNENWRGFFDSSCKDLKVWMWISKWQRPCLGWMFSLSDLCRFIIGPVSSIFFRVRILITTNATFVLIMFLIFFFLFFFYRYGGGNRSTIKICFSMYFNIHPLKRTEHVWYFDVKIFLFNKDLCVVDGSRCCEWVFV